MFASRQLLIASLFIAAASPLRAQAIVGYTPANAATERRIEAAAIAIPDSGRARAISHELSRTPHIAGTPEQARTRDEVIARMKAMGLETEVRAYRVWLPHASAVQVWRVSPDSAELSMREPPLPGDSSSVMPQYPLVNGSSAAGDVRGEVVYVNYGLISDYRTLDSLGVSVKGKIAIARYGRSFRGIKAREAEKHGAVGLIIYSDPQDDGYARGDVLPGGPMRPDFGVQRGSVQNADGDPSTPGYASVEGVKRVPRDSMTGPRIPVVPMSYGNASELLHGIAGTSIPQSWQGGLPFRYHVGPGPVVARIRVVLSDTAFRMIWDTFGIVRGSELPDQYVIIGGHRDAWGPGAADNVSGSVSVLEAARAVAEQVRAGHRPRRTILFATWDAEEWGLVGSTEFVEQDSLRLARGAVAYLNQDVTAQGPNFGGGGSPSLRATLRDVAREVPDPSGKGSVYAVWRTTSAIADTLEPVMDEPGGGSDFAGFYNHLGIPHADWGFGGPAGVYHSAYDSYAQMSKFYDPGFVHHAAAARIGAAMVLRLANADILPYDYAEYGRTMRGYLPALETAIHDKALAVSDSTLRSAIDRFAVAADSFAHVRDGALTRPLAASVRDSANRALIGVERALTRPEGLVGRTWFRSVIYAADADNGYATIIFPTVAEAARAGEADRTNREIADLASRFDAGARQLQLATRLLASGH